jgi:protein gp37
MKCRDLSPVLFLSCEPLLGPVDLNKWLFVGPEGGWEYEGSPRNWISWVIAGGESGRDARPMHPDWARSLRDQCGAAQVAFHFKQWGEFGPIETATPAQQNNAVYHVCERGERVYRVGKKAAGRLLDGREWNEFPNPVVR